MRVSVQRRFWMAIAAMVVLAGCGGGSSSTAGGGIGGSGISYGAVTQFGSIFVNGVEFNTSGAAITKDDSSIPESELRLGMTVEVRGSIDSDVSGNATQVRVEEAVRGPVESAPTGTASAGTLVVLGQTVHVDDRTRIDNNVPDFGAIHAGDVLEVHGQRHADGSIFATFIERSVATLFVVRGTVAGHDANVKTFSIGALSVTYDGATAISDMPAPAGNNWDGLFVEVKGSCTATPVCGPFTATSVEPAGLSLDDAAKAEIEGFVTALTSTSDFTVNAQRVQTTTSTVYAGGLKDEIVSGVKLEVEGTLAGGVLTASKVEFKEGVKIESNATVVGSTITLEGLPGISVTANAFTTFKNTSATTSNLADLDGRNVRIRGRASGASSVIATEIEDRGPADPAGDVILQGSVAKADVLNPTFKILGLTIDTLNLSQGEFKDVNENPIAGGSTEFFSVLAANGGLVKAKGRLPVAPNGNVLAADTLKEVELED